MNINEVIKDSKIIVHEGRYAYLLANEEHIGNHFLITKDKDETTIITEEKNIKSLNSKKEVKWFKLIEIKVSTPFVAKGFLAKITKTIADKDLNVLIVSTFSKDYLLVKEETYDLALGALKQIGFPIKS